MSRSDPADHRFDRWVAKLKIGPRLTVGFALIMGLMLGVALIAVMGLHSLNGNLKWIVENRHSKTELLHKVVEEVNAVSIAVRNALLADEAGRTLHLNRVAAGRETLSGMLATLDSTFVAEDDKSKALQQTLHSDNAAYTVELIKLTRALTSGDVSAANALLQSGLQPKFETYKNSLRALNNYEAQLMTRAQQAAELSYESGRGWIGAMLVLAILLTAVLAWVLTRSIVEPLRGAVDVAQRVAGGDLTVAARAGGRDETGQLLGALAQMTHNLRTLVGQVAEGARTVSDTSTQIAQGNVDLSQRTERQAGTLEETASSLEELTSTVTQNAHNASEANQLAMGASDVARKGGQVVGEVVATMTGISASSKKIADIIGVIDDIAFQTNILALNAAVEAARAGVQGRGFAVVAAEVRGLAQRSAAAAKEIKTLIGESVTKVDAGTRLVDAAGKTMGEIVSSVRQVTDLIAEIAAASQQQSAGIAQVNAAVTQMDQVVQQNAALVEEASAATESMKDQAGSLLQTVSRFKLGADHAGHDHPPEDAGAAHRYLPAQRWQGPQAAPRTKLAPGSASVPIQVKPFATLPPAYAAVLAKAKPPNPARRNGEWTEF